MKERAVDVQRAVVAHNQSPEIAEPADGALIDPTSPVSPQLAPILCGRTNPPLSMGTNQLDAATPQAFSQRIAVVRLVSDYPHRLMPRTSGAMSPSYADRRQRFFSEPDFRRGGSVKVVSQRNSLAVVRHHPLHPLAPLGFSDSSAPFFAGAKLPSRNDSLQFNCWRSLNSLRNARQMFSQAPRSSQSASAASTSKDAGTSPADPSNGRRSETPCRR